MKYTHLLLAAFTALSGASHAAVQSINMADVQSELVFYDNFDGNTWGRSVTPINWTVTDGTIDIHGSPGDIDYLPGNGYYIDLDGSSPGTLSVGVFLTENVGYAATYLLAGSQRADLVGWQLGANPIEPLDMVDVTFGTSAAVHTMDANDPLTTFTQYFTPTQSGMYALTFRNQGDDWVGAILAEVTIATVPEPTSAALMLLGLGGACWASRRSSRQKA